MFIESLNTNIIDQSINLRSRVGLGPHISHGIHCKFNFSSLEKTPFPLRPQIFILSTDVDGDLPFTDLTDTLEAGETELVFTDASITTDSTVDVYTDTYGINPTNVVVATGSVTLTFEVQSADLGVKVRIW